MNLAISRYHGQQLVVAIYSRMAIFPRLLAPSLRTALAVIQLILQAPTAEC